MTWAGWLLVAYLGGMDVLLVVQVDDLSRWRRDELAALVLWPVMVPAVFAWSRVSRRRRTCRRCGRRYQSRAILLRHRGTCGA